MPTRLRSATLVLAAALAALLVAAGVTGSPAGAVTPDAAVSTAATSAWQWIAGRTGSGTVVTTASQIRADRSYPANWTGAVSGTFTPRGISAPVQDAAVVDVDSPADVPGSYAGVLTGHITLAPSAGRWIVQVYRDTSTGRVQVPLQTLVGADGTFSVDLGSVATPPAGTWALGLLDAQNGYASAGTAWPDPGVYAGWQVRAYVVTDTAYLVNEQPARSDNTFDFPSSSPGTKIFQLVDTASGAVLAEQAPDFGLVRSFAGGTRVFTYDQALAVVAGIGVGADVHPLVSGLQTLQQPNGSFVESADVRNPAAAAPLVRTGISAVATYALLRAAQNMPTADPTRAAVLSAAGAGVDWLLSQQRADGLIGAGTGDYRSDGSLDPDARPAWVSTEHNLDAWQTLRLAGTVRPDAATATAAARLGDAIVSSLWDAPADRFLEGLAADGGPDTTDPLDVSSWGALFLSASGHPDLAAQALAHVSSFASARDGNQGYRAYYPQPAFPGAVANVWAEGTGGVVLARTRAGDATGARADLASLAGLQQPDGSLPYAVVDDANTGMSSLPSVAGTAWFVLASLPPGASIWA